MTPAAGELTLATYNVENLGPDSGPEKFARLARDILEPLGAPAVLALQEVQDDSGSRDDGTVGAGLVWGALAAQVRALGGPCYCWRQVDPEDNRDGGIRGANIRLGFLYDPARVEFVDRGRPAPRAATRPVAGPRGVELSISPGRVAPSHRAWDTRRELGYEGTRKPLAAELRFRDRHLFLVTAHLKSKSGAGSTLLASGEPLPDPRGEGQRLEQARLIHGFAAALLDLDPAAALVVLGDMNDFPDSPVLAALKGHLLHNLLDDLPAAERYTYVHGGSPETLDHCLVSPALRGRARARVLHLNAGFFPGDRASDHDPVVVTLDLP